MSKNSFSWVKKFARKGLLAAAVAGLFMAGQNADASVISDVIDTGAKNDTHKIAMDEQTASVLEQVVTESIRNNTEQKVVASRVVASKLPAGSNVLTTNDVTSVKAASTPIFVNDTQTLKSSSNQTKQLSLFQKSGAVTGAAAPTPTLDEINTKSESYLSGTHGTYTLSTDSSQGTNSVIINGTTYYYTPSESTPALNADLVNLVNTGSAAMTNVGSDGNWVLFDGTTYWGYDTTKLPTSAYMITSEGASSSNYNFIAYDGTTPQYKLINVDVSRMKTATGTGALGWTKSNSTEAASYTWDGETFPQMSTIKYETSGEDLTSADGMVRFKLPGVGENVDQYYKFSFTTDGSKHVRINDTLTNISDGYFYGYDGGEDGGAIYNTKDKSAVSIISDFVANSISSLYAYGTIYNGGSIGSIIGRFIGNKLSSYSDAEASGGAIYNGNGLEPAIIGSITGDFIGNSATADNWALGGAIGNYQGTIGSITGKFIGNSVSGYEAHGGAIYNYGIISSISGDFIGNSAIVSGDYGRAYGGAIYNEGKEEGETTIGSITGDFIGNSAIVESECDEVVAGGAIYSGGSGTASIGSITGDFIGNKAITGGAQAAGGAIYNEYTNISSIKGNFIGNKVIAYNGYDTTGGAIYNGWSYNEDDTNSIDLITGNFINNSAEGGYARGGAIFNNDRIGTITGNFINNSVVGSGDTGYASGGAIYNNYATINSIKGDFIGNSAIAGGSELQAYGGAICNNGGEITLGGNTFTGNEGYSFGKIVPNSIDNMGTINIADGATVTINDGYDGNDNAQLNIGTSESSGSVFNLSVDNDYIQTDNLGKVTNNGTFNWDLDVDFDAETQKSDLVLVKSGSNLGSVVIRAINLMADPTLESGYTVRVAEEGSILANALTITGDILSVHGSTGWWDVTHSNGLLTFAAGTAPFVSGGGTIDDLKEAAPDVMPTLAGKYDLTTEKGEHTNSIVIDGTIYYFTPKAADQDKLSMLNYLAGSAPVAIKEDTDATPENYLFKVGSTYYTFDTDKLPESVWEVGEGSSDNYSYVTYDIGEGGALTPEYHTVVLRPAEMTTTGANVWEKSGSAVVPFSFNEGTKKGTGTIGVNMPHNGATATEYYTYNYTLPTGYESSDRIASLSGNVENKYFYNKGASEDNGGAIFNTSDDGYSIKAEFLNNHALYGGAIYNSLGTIGSITGDFIQNSSGQGGAIYNEGTIGSITGDFIGNSSPNDGGAIYNDEGATINSITGDFIDNSSPIYGGAIYNEGTIGSITGDFISNTNYGPCVGYGAAIYNCGTIGSITADFIGNSHVGLDYDFANGGAISNYYGTINSITGDFIANTATDTGDGTGSFGGAIYNNESSIGSITGDFIGNIATSEGSNVVSYGGAINNVGSEDNNSIIGSITGDFIGNSVIANGGYAQSEGGAIFNGVDCVITSISGDFTGNSATGDVRAYGGAISNYDTITSISGNFTGNNVTASSTEGVVEAYGGAIYNSSTINSITGDFIGNSAVGADAHGGAIYTTTSLTLKADGGVSTISGNYVSADGVNNDYEAIYVKNYDSVLTLNATNGGQFVINDYINGDGTTDEAYTVAMTGDADSEIGLFNDIKNGNVTIQDVKLNFANGEEARNYTFDKDFTVTGSIAHAIDVNLQSPDADRFTFDAGSTVSAGAGSIVISTINLINDQEGPTDVFLTNNETLIAAYILSETLQTEGITHGEYRYTVAYEDGYLKFVGSIAPTDSLAIQVHSDEADKTYTLTDTETVAENLGNLHGTSLAVDGDGHDIVGGSYEGISVADGQTLSFTNVSDVTGFADSTAVTNSGKLEITDSKFTSNIVNNNEMELIGANTLNGAISGSNGQTTVSAGTTTFGADLTQNDLTVASGAGVVIDADNLNITNAVKNDGTVTLTDGTLKSSIANDAGTTGKTVIDGAVSITSGKTIDQAIEVASGTDNKLTANAASIGGVVTNNATVELTGGVLGKNISGSDGEVDITTGTVTNSATISAKSVVINSTLNTAANTVSATDGITNNGTLVLSAGEIQSNIQKGSSNGTVNIAAGTEGVVSTTHNITNQTVNVNTGTLHLNLGSDYATQIAGSTVNVANGAVLNTIDGVINDYSSTVKLANGAIVNADINYDGSTLSIDRYAKANNTTTSIKLGAINSITTGNFQSGEVQIVDNGVAVDGESIEIVSATGKTVTVKGSGLADGKVLVSESTSTDKLNGAVYTSETKSAITYVMTENETVNHDKPALGHIKDIFEIKSNNTTQRVITADQVGTYSNTKGLIVDSGKKLTVDNIKFVGFKTGVVDSTTYPAADNRPYDGNYEGIITVKSGAELVVKESHFTVNDGNPKKIAIANYGTVTSDPSIYEGGVMNYKGATFTVNEDTFQNIDRTGENGGAIYNEAANDPIPAGTVTLNKVTATNNKAANGGVLYNAGTATINGGSFTYNQAIGEDAKGGAIYSSADLAINANSTYGPVTFSNNTAAGDGNDIYMKGTSASSRVTLSLKAADATNKITLGSGIDGQFYDISVNDAGGSTSTVALGTVTGATNVTIANGIVSATALTADKLDITAGSFTSTNDDIIINQGTNTAGTIAVETAGKKLIIGNDLTTSKYTNNGLINAGIKINSKGTLETKGVDSTTTPSVGFTGDVNNAGTLKVTSGTINSNVSGDAGALQTATGVIIASGKEVTQGSLDVTGTLTNNGTLTVKGNITGSSTPKINGSGNINLNGGTSTTVTATNSITIDSDGDVVIGGYVDSTGGSISADDVSISSGKYLKINANKLTDEHDATIQNAGTLELAGGTSMTATVTNANAVTGAGSTVISGFVTQTAGKAIDNTAGISVTGGLVANASDLDAAVTNSGTVQLVGGQLDSAISGTGSTVIAGTVTNSSAITQETGGITIASGSLTTNANNVTGAITNNATGGLVLTGGTNGNTVGGSGSTVIDGTVTSNVAISNSGGINILASTTAVPAAKGKLTIDAANIGADVDNAGLLEITGTTAQTLSHNITDTTATKVGETTIKGSDVTLNSGNTIAQAAVTIDTGAKLTANAGSISTNSSSLTNNGTFVINGGADASHYADNALAVAGTGKTEITGFVNQTASLAGNSTVDDAISVGSGAGLKISADNVDAKLTNNGALELSTGTLEKAILGGGATTIAGAVTNSSEITQSTGGITIASGSLTTNASNVTGAITNNAANGLVLTGGTNGNTVTGSGSTVIDGTVTSNAKISNNAGINILDAGHATSGVASQLTIGASNVGTTVDNDGKLILNAGTLSNAVSGDGTTEIAGAVTNSSTITQETGGITIASGSLTTNASNVTGAITNNAASGLVLTGGTNGNTVTGSGSTVIDGTVTSNAAISNTAGINILDAGHATSGVASQLTIGASNVGTTVDNDGKLILNAGTLSNAVSGDGTTEIAGAVTNSSTITQETGGITIDSTGSLATATTGVVGAITNDGLLTFNNTSDDGTLGQNIAGSTSSSGGIVEIAAGDGVKIGLNGKTITNNSVKLTSGIFDITDGTNKDLSAPAPIIANGGTLSVQDGKYGTITLGAVNTDTTGLNVAIDAQFTTGSRDTDNVFKGSSDIISGSVTTAANKIHISNIKIADAPGSTATDPAATEFKTQIATAASAGAVDVTATTLSVLTPGAGNIEFTYDSTTGYLTGKHSTLSDAVTSTIASKMFNMATNGTLTNGSGALDLGGTSLSITGNGNSILSTDNTKDGINVNGKTLSIANATIGSATQGFATAIDNATVAGGTVNLTDVTFTGNTTDIDNSGTLNLANTGTNTNTIATIADTADTGTTNVNSGSTTISGSITQATVNVGETVTPSNAALTVDGAMTVTTLNVNTANSTFTNNGGTAVTPNTVTGALTNAGTVANAGYLTAGTIDNNNTLTNAKDSVLTATTINNSGSITNDAVGTGTAAGSIVANITNDGNNASITNNGTITGNITNTAGLNNIAINNAGTITGDINNGNGANNAITNTGLLAGGTITNAGGKIDNTTVGASITSAIDNKSGTLSTLASQISGAVGNDGTINLSGTNATTGALGTNITASSTAAGTGNVNVSGIVDTNGKDITQATMTIGNNGTAVADATFTNNASDINLTGDLTLSAGATAAGTSLTNTADATITVDDIVNNGTITNNDATGGTNVGSITANGNITNNKTITNHGAISAANGTIANAANATITNDGDITANAVTNAANGVITTTASGIISTSAIANDGTLNLNAGDGTQGALASAIANGTGAGTTNIEGEVATNGNAITQGALVVGHNGTTAANGTLTNTSAINAGTVDVTGNGTLNNTTGTITTTGNVTVASGGSVDNDNTMSVGGKVSNSGTIDNSSSITATGNIENAASGVIDNTGTLQGVQITNASGGKITSTAAGLVATDTANGVVNNGTLNLNGVITTTPPVTTGNLASVITGTTGTTNVSGTVATNGHNITQSSIVVGNNGTAIDNGTLNVGTTDTVTAATITTSKDATHTGTLANAGTVIATTSIDNNGTLTNAHDAVIEGTAGGAATTINNSGSITNDAKGTGTAAGNIIAAITNDGAGASITNNGTITGSITNTAGLNNITIDNDGSITGNVDNGNGANNVITNKANGTIGTTSGNTLTNSGGKVNNVLGGTIKSNIDNNSGIVNTTASGFTGGLDNDGTANIKGTAAPAAADVLGSAIASITAGSGTTNIEGNVATSNGTTGYNITQGTVNIGDDGTGTAAVGSLANANTITATNINVSTLGTLTNTGNIAIPTAGTTTITNEGTTNFNAGDVDATSIVTDGSTNTSAATNFSGGTVDASNITNNGGTNTFNGATVGANTPGAITNNGGDTNISAGSVTATGITNSSTSVADDDVSISGGTVNVTNTAGTGAITNEGAGDLNISGGNVTANDANGGIKNSATGTTAITGGTVAATTIENAGAGTLDINQANPGPSGTDSVTATTIANTGSGSTEISSVVNADNVKSSGTGKVDVNATNGQTATSDLLKDKAGTGTSLVDTTGGGVVAINANTLTTSSKVTLDNNVMTTDGTGTFELVGNSGTAGSASNPGTVFDIAPNTTIDGGIKAIIQSGQLNLGKEDDVLTNGSTLEVAPGATLNTMSGATTSFDQTTFDDASQVKVDVNAISRRADNFQNAQVNPTDGVTMTDLALQDLDKVVHNNTDIYLAKATGLNNLTIGDELLNKKFQAMTPIRIMEATVNADGVLNIHPSSGRNDYNSFNPSVVTGIIAAQLGGYLSQLNSYDEAFRNLDMKMLMTREERNAYKMANRYASEVRPQIFSETYLPEKEAAGWFRPYASFEKVGLKYGPRAGNIMYGSFFGGDSQMYETQNGWDYQYSVYIGYNGSHQTWAGNSIYQNGGNLGATGVWYKGDFFTALTANVGASVADASTFYGSEDFPMLMAGVASKTGYNWELAKGKFIIQPSFLMSYTFVNTFAFTNAAGVRIKSDPLNAINMAPGLKFIGNLKHGWQPYASVQMVWNIMDKADFHANDIGLPEMSVKPYFQYGVGLQKRWGERFTGYFQAMLRNGGRNGVALSAGFRWALGKGEKSSKNLTDGGSYSKKVLKSQDKSKNTALKQEKPKKISKFASFLSKMDGDETYVNVSINKKLATDTIKPSSNDGSKRVIKDNKIVLNSAK